MMSILYAVLFFGCMVGIYLLGTRKSVLVVRTVNVMKEELPEITIVVNEGEPATVTGINDPYHTGIRTIQTGIYKVIVE